MPKHAELIRPITSTSGEYTTERPRPIDEVHRRAVLHKGIWLHVLTADNCLLLIRRSSSMITCPGGLSVVGEHSSTDETDEHCVRRAVTEELPAFRGFGSELMHPLRPIPRWFLYDYPDGARRDRSLISEWLLRLPLNSSLANAQLDKRLWTGLGAHAEVEASEMRFVPIAEYASRLMDAPQTFCAPGLLPASLVDSVSDICLLLRAHGPLPVGCSALMARRRHSGYASALLEEYDAKHVVSDPLLSCARRKRPAQHAAKRLISKFNCSGGFLLAGDVEPPPPGFLSSETLPENLGATAIILTLAFLGFRRLNRFMKEILI